jgi:hypothetical protein
MSEAYAGYQDYLDYLATLHNPSIEYFLEGGQAVNYWAEFINSRLAGRPLDPLRPFTSKDCDIWVSSKTWDSLKRNKAIRQGKSPADGQLGIQTLSVNPPRVLDILSSVYGIDVKEYPRLMKRALDDGTIRVIDPIYLFLSKCHCLTHLPQDDRQDERHVRMLAMILPEYFTFLIADAEKSEISDRDLLKEIKLLRKMGKSGICQRVMKNLEIESKSLIPWDRLESSSSILLAKYSSSQSGLA